MDIVKIENPGMAYMLMPWYLDTWEPIEKTTCRLYQMMAEDPGTTLCCAAVEDDRVHGVAMAYIDGKDCVIWQMNGVNAKQIDPPMSSWARSRGCDKLVIHTNRNPKTLERRHGFKLDKTEEIDNMTKHTMSRAI
jgi:hypothetical protein